MTCRTPLRIGILTTDNRDHYREYHHPEPIFGTAVAALLEGFAEFPAEVEIHVLSVTQKPLSAPSRLAPNIFYHSLRVPKIGWLRTGYQGCIRAVRRKVRELELPLVHGQGTERDCALEAVFSGLPNVITLHGNMRAVARAMQATPFSYHGFHSLLEALAIRRADEVFCNSSYTESCVRPLNARVVSMPNPVRKIFFSAPPAGSASTHQPLRLLVVGLVCSYKQPLEILRALREWRNLGGPPFRCLWVGALSGETAYVQSFQEELQAARSAGWADHRVSMPEVELRDTMDASDVLLHLPREEAFGLVVAEAMMRGLKILAGRVGGIPDFAKLYPGITLVDIHRPEEWIQNLAEICRAGVVRISRESWGFMTFHPRVIAQKHLDHYARLLASRSLRRAS